MVSRSACWTDTYSLKREGLVRPSSEHGTLVNVLVSAGLVTDIQATTRENTRIYRFRPSSWSRGSHRRRKLVRLSQRLLRPAYHTRWNTFRYESRSGRSPFLTNSDISLKPTCRSSVPSSPLPHRIRSHLPGQLHILRSSRGMLHFRP